MAATQAWKALITSRRSSGSSSEASAVESARSQNITVTCRRSACVTASMGRRPDGDVPGSKAACVSASTAPQLPQNLAPEGFSTPQAAQEGGSDAPQSPQNFLPVGFEIPQLGQSMGRLRPDVSDATPQPRARPSVWPNAHRLNYLSPISRFPSPARRHGRTAISARLHPSHTQSYAVRRGFERSGTTMAHCKHTAIQQRAVQHLAVTCRIFRRRETD